jgi:hypothetical protein
VFVAFPALVRREPKTVLFDFYFHFGKTWEHFKDIFDRETLSSGKISEAEV